VTVLLCRLYQAAARLVALFVPFRQPVLLADWNALADQVRDAGAVKALVVTDPTLLELGLAAPLMKALEEAGIGREVYDGVEPDPTTAHAAAACKLYRDRGCGAVIALGGGSPTDCAKAACVLAAYPDAPLERRKGLRLRVRKKTPLLIAVPTTAGSGSEATVAAVLTDEHTHQKFIVSGIPLIPDCALHDPALTAGLPKPLTAQTGMDALTHAVESYIGKSSTKESRRQALEAVRLIFGNLRAACENGADLDARANLQRAAFLAGASFTRAYVGNVHAAAHALGGVCGAPHGLANAVLLPIVLEDYGHAADRRMAELAFAAGCADPSKDERRNAAAFLEAVRSLSRDIGIPETIPEMREEDIPQLVRLALKEANPVYPVPVIYGPRRMERVLRRALGQERLDIAGLLELQREYFASGATGSAAFRVEKLRMLEDWIRANTDDILTALKEDLGKAPFEGYATEVDIALGEIRFLRRRLAGWMRDKRALPPLWQFPSRVWTRQEPYGCALIMSPWNYPFQLTVVPLAAAVAAGNCAVVKPSAYSPATSALVARMVRECFGQRYVAAVTGGRAENAALLGQEFDCIFFTGGAESGRTVLRAAAEHLTPVTLELGGKSPCVVDETADIALAARRVAWGKCLNAGQTCVAPDYLVIHDSVREAFIAAYVQSVRRFYGEDPLRSDDYPKIVNQKHFERVTSLLEGSDILAGGESDPASRKISPALVAASWDSDIMREEIFGPVLPVIAYRDLREAAGAIRALPKPLAFYLFTASKENERYLLGSLPFGGCCVNDTVVHLSTPRLPFGGVGESGMGSYHGKAGFDTFSHTKSFLSKSRHVDLPMRYPPYREGLLKLLRKL